MIRKGLLEAALKEVHAYNTLLSKLTSIKFKKPTGSYGLDEAAYYDGYNDCLEEVLTIVTNVMEGKE